MAALSGVGFIAVVAHEAWPQRMELIAEIASVLQSPEPPSAVPVAAVTSTRPVYRLSIVSGGAYSRSDVADAMRTDAVVAAHYQDVDVDKVHATRVTGARAVYVSYRVGNQVYWTKNRVKLAPGETVLTDGRTEIRARCGNLLSNDARGPVADHEPPVALLDQPETGSSTMTGERADGGPSPHVPFFEEWSGASSIAFERNEFIPGADGLDMPMFSGGNGAGSSPYLGSSTGTGGTSLVGPLGSSARGSTDHNGDGNGNNGSTGSNGSNDHNGGGNGNNGGGNGNNGKNDGPGGGGDGFVPPVTTGTATTTGTTTTGTTTTGNVAIDTTGGVTTGVTTGGDGDDDVQSVPEPSSLMLVGLGAIGVVSRAIRRRRS